MEVILNSDFGITGAGLCMALKAGVGPFIMGLESKTLPFNLHFFCSSHEFTFGATIPLTIPPIHSKIRCTP